MTNDTKNLNVDGMMDEYINKLVIEAGMDENVDEDVLGQLKNDLKDRLQNRINAVLLAHIPENKLEEFEKLLDSGSQQETQSFCAENIPNLAELIASEFLGFRSRYIS